jgi:anti-sigma B factor antagonist
VYERSPTGVKTAVPPAEIMEVWTRGEITSPVPARETSKAREHTMHAVQEMESPTGSIFVISQRELAGDTTVLSVEGELDLSSAPRLKWALADSQSEGAKHLIVDLSEVTFIDSTALGVLVGAQRAMDEGLHLAIVCAEENVLRIFELTGLDGMFEILPNLDDALEFVRGSAAAAD